MAEACSAKIAREKLSTRYQGVALRIAVNADFRSIPVWNALSADFVVDSNLFCEHKMISEFEESINNELSNVHTWLCANRLSLNIDKSNLIVIFHPPQKNV